MILPEINQEVVRSRGDYVVGRIGIVVALDSAKRRAQVAWNNNPKTWVSFDSIEPTSIPYEIYRPEGTRQGRGRRALDKLPKHPHYRRV